MKTGTIGKGYDNMFSSQKTNSMVFSSIDNQPHNSQHFKKLKSIQPNRTKEASKENWNSHVFVSSPYDQPTVHHPFTNTKQPIKVIPQTFTTNIRNERIERTIQRPTMGGKTIGAIHHLPATTTINHPNRMSSEELKLLSRRINPHEPLASPHASPRKPPLPNMQRSYGKKRLFKEYNDTAKDDQEENQPSTKKMRQFTCEPCKKVYKTRNGFIYHKQKCKKIIKFESNAIIDCVCEHPTDDTGTMIECTKCNKWLHLRCSGGVTKEDSYCCPRCNTTSIWNMLPVTAPAVQLATLDTALTVPNSGQINDHKIEEEKLQNKDDDSEDDDDEEEQHIFRNGQTVGLSALCQAKERGKNLIKTFQETAQETDAAKEEEDNETNKNNFNFISLFNDELNMDAGNSTLMTAVDSPALPPSSIIADNEDWTNDFGDFNSSDWCNDDVPSLLFSDNNPPSSVIDDFITSDIPSSPNMTQHQQEADWLHFANFDFDFTSSD